MSRPVDSEADESRSLYFGAKRTLAAAEGADSGASTPSKRSRRSRRGPQNHRDFVPMGGSFANSGQVTNAISSDAGNSSDSAAVSASDPESHPSRSIDTEENTNGQSTTTPKLLSERPILGRNRLITGFAKIRTQPSTATDGGASEVSRNQSISHNSIGESADDAIEISDDTDLDDESEDGGMMINVDGESISGSPVPLFQGHHSYENVRQLRVTGWARNMAVRVSGREQAESANVRDRDVKDLCKFLQNKSFPKQIRNMKFCTYERDGDTLIISVRSKDAASYMNLNGCKYSGKTITIENLNDVSSTPPRIDLSDGEVDELPLVVDRSFTDDAHQQLQGSLERSFSSQSTKNSLDGPGPAPQRLGELSSGDFENQVKYTLFHLKRDQIDLNRPAVCITCLQEGHQETSCPESNCIHCGAENEHPSRLCPVHRRCLKCRERGHDVDTCISKLLNTAVPCDNCGSAAHLEDSCPFHFFPSQSQSLAIDMKLWISCCVCASKTHLVGDCPEWRSSSQAAAWSLRSLDPMQFSNLSLESGTRTINRDAEVRGTRQDGLQIKGRADTYSKDAPSMRPPAGMQDSFSRRGGRNRVEDRVSERERRTGDRGREVRDDLYRPSSDSRPTGSRYDRYESGYTDYRDDLNDRRDRFYATDSFGRRHRSRSPDSRNFRGPQGQHTSKPPLPKEPLPTRPPPPSNQRFPPPTSSELPNRRRTVDKGPPGVDRYTPMPRAAKQAWNKHRL